MIKATVIGYGSIGARHARILKELGCHVSVVSRRLVEWDPLYPDISSALKTEQPQYVVIAGKTQEHYETLTELLQSGFSGKLLVEKPLFHEIKYLPEYSFSHFCVAYNLRFHPILQMLKRELKNERVLSVQGYVGQYLPGWRPQRDYRLSYSAFRHEGGGVLRDLSHELDYLLWLFGEWQSVSALGGHYSNLEIETEDVVTALFSTSSCPAISVQMNYLDRIGQRQLVINTLHHTFIADLVKNTLTKDSEVLWSGTLHKDQTYAQQHQDMLAGNIGFLCSAHEGLLVLQLIDAIERSIQSQLWISL